MRQRSASLCPENCAMLDNPKVSVVITTYNRARLLPRAVNSVLAQTYDDYEIIIVDDCSNDDTQQVISEFTDSRIHHFRHDINRGLSAARNTGIANARGEYIAFLDDDDEYVSVRLARQVALLDESLPEVAMVYGHTAERNDSPDNVADENGRVITSNVYEEALAGGNVTGSISFLARTSVVREIGGFNSELELYEDRFFTCSILQKYKVIFDPQVVAIVHIGHCYPRTANANDMGRSLKISQYYRTHIRTFKAQLELRPKVFAHVLRDYATSEMRCGYVRKAISVTLDAFKLAPLSLRNIFHVTWMSIIFLFYVSPMSRYLGLARKVKRAVVARVS